jgi:hypothetical protein
MVGETEAMATHPKHHTTRKNPFQTAIIDLAIDARPEAVGDA